ncbi:hypothetical protein GOP47_0013480 [Adiantum capillus-veneris]|uniref:ACT domain-containing protein n=1 Tax=Adiantum capillus-veneris TaxID=13818 RepID=A0A9D4ZDF8_ADICA|nr:hypothetical protein GOP47_0013480 [Adiantum capillus-veneris]
MILLSNKIAKFSISLRCPCGTEDSYIYALLGMFQRRKILERQLNTNSTIRQGLEPSNAEFIAALAAGYNSHAILQVGCGISTVALAVAAQTTGGLLVSVHTDESKQDIVRYHMTYLGLLGSVEFLVASEPSNILLTRTNVDFAHFTGDPTDYIKLFDSLNLTYGATVVADNALSNASNDYIRHVRRQPGVESSTLPLARGLEVTKLASWEKFISGRILYSGFGESVMNERENGVFFAPFVQKETTTFTSLSVDEQKSTISIDRTFSSLDEKGDSSITSPDFPSRNACIGESNTQLSDTHDAQPFAPSSSVVDIVSKSFHSHSSDTLIDTGKPLNEAILTTENPSVKHDAGGGVLENACSSAFKVHFQNYSTETEVTITGMNRDMLLSDITTAFSELGISVKTANIETHNDLIEDVFYVTDVKSRAPIHPSEWNSVKERILESLGKRCMR